VGKTSSPTSSYLFRFAGVKWQAGSIKAVCSRGGMKLAEQEKKTAGEPVALRVTPIVAPGGWRADGADVAMFDVEVVDKDGNRSPTDQGRVDFEMNGPASWRGGYNSGKEGSVNNTYLDTEAGINRVFIRSTTTPGMVAVTARRSGLMPGTVTVQSMPVEVNGGLSRVLPASYAYRPTGGPSLPDPTSRPDPGGTPDGGGAGTISAEFQAIYDMLLRPRCGTMCHVRATGAPAGLAMPDAQTALANLVNVLGSDACMMQLRVAPRDADKSLLANKLSAAPLCGTRMPKGCTPGNAANPCFTDAELQRIQAWIDSGAE
jgi:hypothetical protein